MVRFADLAELTSGRWSADALRRRRSDERCQGRAATAALVRPEASAAFAFLPDNYRQRGSQATQGVQLTREKLTSFKTLANSTQTFGAKENAFKNETSVGTCTVRPSDQGYSTFRGRA